MNWKILQGKTHGNPSVVQTGRASAFMGRRIMWTGEGECERTRRFRVPGRLLSPATYGLVVSRAIPGFKQDAMKRCARTMQLRRRLTSSTPSGSRARFRKKKHH